MKPPLMYVWTSALRSGKYPQIDPVAGPNGGVRSSSARFEAGEWNDGIRLSAMGVLTAASEQGRISAPQGIWGTESTRWLTGKSSNLFLDAPPDLRVRDGSGRLRDLCISVVNIGLTHEQVADLIDYFGLRQ